MISLENTIFTGLLTLQILLSANAIGKSAEPFTDVTDQVGLKGVSGGHAAWGDFDNDGWADLAVGGQLWRNDGGKKFERCEEIAFAGSGIWGDIDNDGDLDFFAMGGKVYRNENGKTFSEIEDAIPEMPQAPMTATWAEVDGDGLIDLYVTGYEGGGYHPDFLYRNKGDGTFEVMHRGPATPGRGVTACDYDEDGDIDIYVSNYRLVANALLQNDGKGKFADVAEKSKVDGDGGLGAWGHTIGSSWGDFDNDGHFDIFAGNFSHPPDYQDRPKFYKNMGKEKAWEFSDLSAVAGLHWQESYASPALADFDNDGLLDLFFTTVYPGDRSVMYRNKGDWKFENVTDAVKVGLPQTYQAAWVDFDNDGYPDILHGGHLFHNPGGTNSWLKVRITGKDNVNGSGLGTQIRIKLGEETLSRQVESATGQGNQNDLALNFGLGDHDKNVDLEVRWPDGSKQIVRDVKPNSIVKVIKE